MITKSQVYFARPDAMSGSLIETIRKVNPTIFFAVPRIYEKLEERITQAIDSLSLVKKKIIRLSQYIGNKSVDRRFKGEKKPLLYSIANYLVFSRVKAALGLNKTHIFAFGAAPLSNTTIDFFKSMNIPIFNIYGMSETTGPQFLNISDKGVDLYSTGKTLSGTEVKINNPDRDKVGEFLFRGRNRFMGYYKDELSTIETIDSDGYIHSGDIGYINKEGNLVITGRIKDIIITAGGENIPPIPIETYIKDQCKIISHAVVIGDDRKYLIALITLKTDYQGNFTEEALTILKSLNSDVKNVMDAFNDLSIKECIQNAVTNANLKAISRAQIIRKWMIIPQDFSIQNGELTPTHKVKRKFISQKYSKIIEKMYLEGKF